MIYLFLQAVFSSLFALCIKWVGNRNNHGRNENIFVIGAINYIVAGLVILPVFIYADLAELSAGAMWTGGTMGAIYFIAFFFVIYAIKWVGVSSTTVVSVLSILMPITFAAFYWDLKPNLIQIVGIGLALLALTLIGGKKGGMRKAKRPWFAPFVLLGFFLLCGGSRLSQEAFTHVSLPEQRPTFLLTAFLVASLPSIALLCYLHGYKRQKLMMVELWFGIGLGLTNLLQSFFILVALKYFPGYIVFPVTSAGGILITTVVATKLLEESLHRRTIVGISVAIVALFMLHWS